MTKDVEALFRKINQSDLPYRSFDNETFSPEEPEEPEAVDPEAAHPPEAEPEPAMIPDLPPTPEPGAKTASILSMVRPASPAAAEVPRPSEDRPLNTAGLFRRYAEKPAAAEPAGPAPTRLRDIFARMKS